MHESSDTPYEKFKKKMRNLEPGVRYVYHTGRLDHSRQFQEQLDRIGRFCRAVYSLGHGELFQKRNNEGLIEYVIVLHRKIGMRKDGTGYIQEAERIADAMVTDYAKA